MTAKWLRVGLLRRQKNTSEAKRYEPLTKSGVPQKDMGNLGCFPVCVCVFSSYFSGGGGMWGVPLVFVGNVGWPPMSSHVNNSLQIMLSVAHMRMGQNYKEPPGIHLAHVSISPGFLCGTYPSPTAYPKICVSRHSSKSSEGTGEEKKRQNRSLHLLDSCWLSSSSHNSCSVSGVVQPKWVTAVFILLRQNPMDFPCLVDCKGESKTWNGLMSKTSEQIWV